MTSSVVRLRRSSKVLPKAKLAPKKSWSLFGGLLPVWSTTAFWIAVKPLALRSMLSKSMRCTKNCNACSQHWSTERVQFFSATTPDCTLHNQHFKSSANWATRLHLIRSIHLTSHQLTTTSSSISATFQGKCFHHQQEAENAFQEFIKSWSIDFYATGINQFISHWQKCVDCIGSILINKDVFEPSYNDLKFMVQNHNYFCINLIIGKYWRLEMLRWNRNVHTLDYWIITWNICSTIRIILSSKNLIALTGIYPQGKPSS